MPIGLALLVSADSTAIQQLSHALQEFSISPDVCREVPAAMHLLTHQKFEVVIVDLELGEQSGLILNAIQLSPANRTAVTFVITGTDSQATAAYQKMAGFAFERPLSAESIRRTLKPAYGLILRERRRYFRCPISVPVLIRRDTMPDVCGQSINISEGGMAVSTSVQFGIGQDVQVQFPLVGQKVPFSAASTVCWRKTEHLGVRFLTVPQESQSRLQVWLSQKLEDMLPESVAEKFQN